MFAKSITANPRRAGDLDRDDDDDADSWLFMDAPHLRKVETNMLPKNLFLPWHQLLSLTSVNTPLGSLDCLRQCPNLVDCDLHLFDDNPAPGPPIPGVARLSQLQQLAIEVEGDADLRPIFDGLEVPTLKNFHVTQHRFQAQWPQQQFLSLIDRSSCALTKLDF
jgi:hypothetical protein